MGLRNAFLATLAVAAIGIGAAWAQTGRPGAPAGQTPPPGAPAPGMMGPGMMGPGMMGPGMMGQGMGPGMMGMMGWDRMMPMMRGGMRGMMMGPGMMMDPGMMSQHIEGRLAFLRTELGITEAQAPQWNAFAEALRANAQAMADMHQQMMPMMMSMMQGGSQTMPLPQRLELHERMMTSHLEALRRVRAAAGPLYVALDDRQKRIADGLMMGMM